LDFLKKSSGNDSLNAAWCCRYSVAFMLLAPHAQMQNGIIAATATGIKGAAVTEANVLLTWNAVAGVPRETYPDTNHEAAVPHS
jgi:hypothetical protein